jgi:hypothetical protein
MGFHNGQLPVPGVAIADAASVEMIRAWIAGHKLYCSLRIGAWEHNPEIDERKAWGMVLADAVRHIGDALTREGNDKAETVAVIRASLLTELDRPTTATAGDFVDEPSRN